MAGLRVWITPDRRWRVELKPDGRWSIVDRSLPVAAGRGGEREARAALAALPDAPGWDELVED